MNQDVLYNPSVNTPHEDNLAKMDWSTAIVNKPKFNVTDNVIIIKGEDTNKIGKIIRYVKGSIFCWQVAIDTANKPKWYSTDQLKLKRNSNKKNKRKYTPTYRQTALTEVEDFVVILYDYQKKVDQIQNEIENVQKEKTKIHEIHDELKNKYPKQFDKVTNSVLKKFKIV
jgi:hypothetical protein